MAPAATLCSKCGQRPRRKPGQPCDVCENAWRRDRRQAITRGAPKMERDSEEDFGQRFTRPLEKKRLIITWAQNATPIHDGFFRTLERAARFLHAELVVIPGRYKNPTSQWTQANQRNDWWGISPAAERRGEKNPLAPYLFNTRKKLSPSLVLAADVKIQPTGSSPLSGFEALTGAESCIVGHPKMQLRTVPAPTGRFPKILSTTGACTRRNYTDTKAGKLGAFHHFLGAIVVELSGSEFWLYQVNADRFDGSFTHLQWHFTESSVRTAAPAAGLVQGDTHARFTSTKVDQATHGPGGIVDVLKPEQSVWHDTLDGYAINPHHFGNPFVAAAKAKAGYGDVRAEVEHAVRHVKARTRSRSVIAASNHDDFLSRWIMSADWKSMSASNREFYLETARMMSRSAEMTPTGASYADPFRYWVGRLKGAADIVALRRKQSHKIRGIECGYHGHKGPKGVPGTMKNFARVGAKMITAHAHEPGIEEGHYRVGTSTMLDFEYTDGPSSWLNAHCIIYATGKRSLLFIVGGKWRKPGRT